MRDFAYITVGPELVSAWSPTAFRRAASCMASSVTSEWRSERVKNGEALARFTVRVSKVSPRSGDQGADYAIAIEDLAKDDRVWDSVAWALAQLCHVIVCAAAPGAIAIRRRRD